MFILVLWLFNEPCLLLLVYYFNFGNPLFFSFAHMSAQQTILQYRCPSVTVPPYVSKVYSVLKKEQMTSKIAKFPETTHYFQSTLSLSGYFLFRYHSLYCSGTIPYIVQVPFLILFRYHSAQISYRRTCEQTI